MSDPGAATQSTNANRPFWTVTGGTDLTPLAEVGALLLRVYFGFVICWSAGVSKFPLDGWFADQVAGLGFPMPVLFAWLAAMSEVAGGVLLAIGLATRPAAFFLAFTLGVAAFMFHKIPILSVYTTQHITLKYFWVYVFFAFAGAGRLSLDGLLRRKQALAAGLSLAIVGGLAIYCAGREAPKPAAEVAATLDEAAAVAVAGSFNDWSLTATPMTQVNGGGVWTATITTDAPGPIELKFVADENWDLSAGETDQTDARFPVSGTAEPGPQSANIEAYLPKAGDYRVSLSLPDLAYRVEPAEPVEPTEPVEPPADTSVRPAAEPAK
ncbi:MAG: DoxX family membrane protein [Planctomycetota bacterium]